jgi:hypothetical protein
MGTSGVADAISAILLIGLVTTIVAHPNTASIISAFGSAFTGSLATAEGSAATSSGASTTKTKG